MCGRTRYSSSVSEVRIASIAGARYRQGMVLAVEVVTSAGR